MLKRRINKYRLHNNFSKSLKSKIFDSFFADDFKAGHKKDFAWEKNNNNPYKLKKPMSLRKKIEIALLISSLVATFLIIIYHPFFHMNTINITGLQRIKDAEIKDDILGIMNDKKMFIFPKSSYAFIDVSEIRDILKDKYPIESITVKKNFPNELLINLEEKISTVIYDNGEKYSYLGLDGNIVEQLGKVDEKEWQEKIEITTTTLADGTIREEKKVIERIHKPNLNNLLSKFGNYPVLYDTRNTTNTEPISSLVKPEIVTGIIEWFNFLNKKTDIPFGYIIIEDGMGKGLINTREGWVLIVDLIDRFDTQVDELNLLLKDKIDRRNLNYIDIHYPDKVFWK